MKNLTSLKTFERPREKLAALGPANLTTTELIALLLGSGTKRYPVMQLADQIVKKYETHNFKKISLEKLTEIPGVGKVQAGKLLATFELGKRVYQLAPSRQILSAEDVLREVHDIRNKNREHLIALYLNARNEIVHQEVLTIGGLNFNSLEPRDVFAPAFKYPCLGIILAHNHPSDDPTPSDDDILMTKDLHAAGKLLGIQIIDHLVVTRSSWSSVLAPPPDHRPNH